MTDMALEADKLVDFAVIKMLGAVVGLVDHDEPGFLQEGFGFQLVKVPTRCHTT